MEIAQLAKKVAMVMAIMMNKKIRRK